jgi:GMP synthase-like glutamine amidotransferase
MHIHILQHVVHEGPAYIANWAAERNFSTSATLLSSGNALPEMAGFDWLIILGGPMSVHDEHLHPWLIAEKELIRQAMQQGKIVIGICLGAQLIAHVAGAEVRPNTLPEIGFFPVQFNEAAKNDPVFRFFPKQLTTFHWHGDIFGLPENAVNMASSEITPCQAFRLNETIFGIQFHPESTEESISGMLTDGHPELIPSPYVQPEPVIRKLMTHTVLNNKILSDFLDKITHLKPGFLT